jgi:hypothetical protein
MVYPKAYEKEVNERGLCLQTWEKGALPVIQKVMDHFNRAKALIGGAYKEIA